jgi:hypothetical protein
MSLVSFMGWRIHHMDVKATFLNGIIEKEVYIEQPQGFEISGKESHVCRLKKSLYGLKKAPRAWYNSEIDGYMQSMGFSKRETNSNLYCIFVQKDILILALYVDELFLIGAKKLIVGCKENMAVEFKMNKMKDINMMHYFLGLEVWKRPREIFLGHGKYAVHILKRF